jgi:hypothetical protein
MPTPSTLPSRFKRKSREGHVRTFLLERTHRTTVTPLNTWERKSVNTPLRRSLTALEFTTSRKILISTAKHARDNKTERVQSAAA